MTPIIVALILSVPLSVYASRVGLGERARRLGLFLIPEETDPPPELRDLHAILGEAQRRTAALPPTERDGFVRAAVDPYANAIHHGLAGRRRSLRPSIRAARQALLERALAQGPAALGAAERKILLLDPDMVDELHNAVWSLPRDRAQAWGRPAAAGARER